MSSSQNQHASASGGATGGTTTTNAAIRTTRTAAAPVGISSNDKVLRSAPPPWHAVTLLGIFMVLFSSTLPTLPHLDEVATFDIFVNRHFPNYMSIYQLAMIRAIIALSIWIVTAMCVFGKGWDITTPYLPQSKLISVPNRVVGLKTLRPFTSWSWMLLGMSFTLSSYIAFQVADDDNSVVLDPRLLRLALICWEISAPCTLLVAFVTRYAIWPAVVRRGGKHALGSFRNIMMHNANVLFALTESCLLSGLSVRWSHASLAPLWGCAYVVFAWNISMSWNEAKYGPQFIYFFMDTTLPGYYCSIALLVLLLVLLFFYGLFCTAEEMLNWIDGGVWTHVAFVGAVSSLVMRFRD